MNEMRVGIIGTGGIARSMALACGMTDGVRCLGASSRSREKAERFAAAHGLERVYDGAEALVNDPDIDLVYVAIPHAFHYEHCLLALRANKHVLCEKPMCLNREDSEALFNEARARGLFLMEGMWSRFLPNNMLAKRWIDEGRVGKVWLADGSFSARQDPGGALPRLFEYEQAGGALFDLGVYPIEMISWFVGENPASWSGESWPWAPGVDGATALALRYPGGALATVRSSFYCGDPAELNLYGEKGRIRLTRFFSGHRAELIVDGSVVERAELDCEHPRGFTWEIAAVRDCLARGLTECPVVPAEDTLAAARIMGDVMHRFYPEHYPPKRD